MTVAAYLHAAGHPVLLCGHSARESIEVRPDDHDPILLPGPAHTDPAELDGPVDAAFLAVKDTQNEQAGALAARLCDERTVVCALQNGVEQVERVGRFCPSSTVVPAAVWISSEKAARGLGAGADLSRGWCCRTPRWPRCSRKLLRGAGGNGRARARLQYRRLAQAVGQLGGRLRHRRRTGRRAGIFRCDDVAALGRRYGAECRPWRAPTAPTSATG